MSSSARTCENDKFRGVVISLWKFRSEGSDLRAMGSPRVLIKMARFDRHSRRNHSGCVNRNVNLVVRATVIGVTPITVVRTTTSGVVANKQASGVVSYTAHECESKWKLKSKNFCSEQIFQQFAETTMLIPAHSTSCNIKPRQQTHCPFFVASIGTFIIVYTYYFPVSSTKQSAYPRSTQQN